ncbi:hypothetical protein RRG08_007655 [Elysia crispata]|uniref:Uncharacterized protein n=1 Tax=Elysia crispata TaxID=231223 RepID=A0AAE1CRT2_9GAST|nr:hypothetical protein RRG08_007655 [Elysia crispata]
MEEMAHGVGTDHKFQADRKYFLTCCSSDVRKLRLCNNLATIRIASDQEEFTLVASSASHQNHAKLNLCGPLQREKIQGRSHFEYSEALVKEGLTALVIQETKPIASLSSALFSDLSVADFVEQECNDYTELSVSPSIKPTVPGQVFCAPSQSYRTIRGCHREHNIKLCAFLPASHLN